MMPVIGPAPRHQNLWFAFGHAHHGLTLGPRHRPAHRRDDDRGGAFHRPDGRIARTGFDDASPRLRGGGAYRRSTLEPVAPRRQRSWKRQRRGLVDAPGDGTGEAVAGDRADLDQVLQRRAGLGAAGRGGEHGVAVGIGVGEAQRLCRPPLAAIARRLACALVSAGVGGDERDGRAGLRPAFPRKPVRPGRAAGGPAEPAELRSRSNGAAQKCGPSPITAEAIAFTTTSAPTRNPEDVAALAEPSPPFRVSVVAQ
jgi:hypothetical protein